MCDEWENELRARAIDMGITNANTLVVSLDDFRRHLSHHLEQLALFSIPPNLERMMESDSRKGSYESHSHGADIDVCSLRTLAFWANFNSDRN